MTPNQVISVFLSYAPEDDEFREQLIAHLSNLEHQGVISAWHDRKVMAGQEWQEEANQQLDASQLILLLISADFLHSSDCYGTKMTRALERHHRHEARVVPVLLRPVDWEGSPLSDLQVLPSNGVPVSQWEDLDAAFLDVVTGIRSVIEDIDEAIGEATDGAIDEEVDGPIGPIEEGTDEDPSDSGYAPRPVTVDAPPPAPPSPKAARFVPRAGRRGKPKLSAIARLLKTGDVIVLASLLMLFPAFLWELLRQPDVIRVPLRNAQSEQYYYDLLELALRETQSEGDFVLEKVEVDEPQINMLAQTDDTIDVAWMMTNYEREYHARPIKIPLTRGLLGYRICMTAKDGKTTFDDVTRLSDFIDNGYAVGQVHNWPDTRILREAGIDVQSSETKDYLFRILDTGEIDCFPRGIPELLDEQNPRSNLTSDDALFFKYRSPVYFFVSNRQVTLARRIERGLERALKNGEFCNLLMEHYGDDIRDAELPQRRRIKLRNYDLPDDSPTQYYLNFEIPGSLESQGQCSENQPLHPGYVSLQGQ